MQKKRVLLILLAVELAGFASAAHAYLDPGTGSILVQSLLAGIAGAAAVFSLYWRRVKDFFAKRKPSHDAHSSATTPDNDA